MWHQTGGLVVQGQRGALPRPLCAAARSLRFSSAIASFSACSWANFDSTSPIASIFACNRPQGGVMAVRPGGSRGSITLYQTITHLASHTPPHAAIAAAPACKSAIMPPICPWASADPRPSPPAPNCCNRSRETRSASAGTNGTLSASRMASVSVSMSWAGGGAEVEWWRWGGGGGVAKVGKGSGAVEAGQRRAAQRRAGQRSAM